MRNDTTVQAWLRPGNDLACGGTLPDGRFGVRLADGVELTGTGEQLGQLGDRIAAHYVSERTAAVDEVALQFDIGGIPSLTCSEADALARMLATFGHLTTAASLIQAHSHIDDDGDRHGYIGALALGTDGYETSLAAAGAYVRQMTGGVPAHV